MVEQALYTQIATVAALGSRIYPDKLPQNVVYPAAVYTLTGPENRFLTFGRDAGPVEATFQVDVYDVAGKGKQAFNVIATATRRALQRHSDAVIIDIFMDTGRDQYEDETDLFRKSYDVRVWYRET